jgi:radical SAM superfamily enzyme YgiQ (UPF0313 family)
LLDVEQLGGIYAFLDGFSGERKSPEDYAELAQRGLKRVYIGMESGNNDLLHFLKKPGRSKTFIRPSVPSTRRCSRGHHRFS